MIIEGLALAESGELDGVCLPVDPAIEGVREYRGGVLYLVSGVAGFELGGRPSSFRWAGVRGISARSSLARTRGRHAMTMFHTGSV